MKYVLTSLLASLPRFLQLFTTLPEEWAREAPRVLEPEANSDLLQVSLRHMFIMPRSVCIFVHKIMLQFYVCFYAFIPHVVSCIFPFFAFNLSCAFLS
jgi:hypothetical protein